VTHPNRRPSAPSSHAPAGAGRLYVAIVSKNPETIRGFESYLRAAGIPSNCSRAIRGVEGIVPDFATAAVIFPDDFGDADVLGFLRRMREDRPLLLAILVTREPQRFQAATEPDGRSLPPLILPRLSFGWDILDVIRAHGEANLEPT
jgi:hypothetical protein